MSICTYEIKISTQISFFNCLSYQSAELYIYKCTHFVLFSFLSTSFIHHFHSHTKILTLILLIPTQIPSIPAFTPRIPILILRIPTPIPHIPTRIPHIPTRIPYIPTLILRILIPIPWIPIIPTLILQIPIIPALIPHIPTLIPCIPIIPLMPFPHPQFRLLQIVEFLYKF